MIRNFEFVGFGERFVARIIDTIAVLALFWGIAIVLGMIMFTTTQPDSPMLFYWMLIIFALIIIVPRTYYIILHKLYGQTVGKKLLGIKVVKTNGEPLTWSTAILREIGEIINAFTIGIGYLLIIFDKEKQGLHDKIANTYVVRVK